MLFETKECTNPDIVKELFVEYSHIKGAENCFVSFDKELNDLPGYYSGAVKESVCLSDRNTEEKDMQG